jgi:pimeloyl-[acyl-carrier protein] methyl ester esterase
VLRAGLDLLRDEDLRATAAAIRCPVLVLHGDRDFLCPPGAGRWLAEHVPNARLASHPKAAHAPFLSHPDWFEREVRKFLESMQA